MFVQQDLDCVEVSPVKFLGAASLSKINWHLHHISFPQVQDKPWFNYNKSIERVHRVFFVTEDANKQNKKKKLLKATSVSKSGTRDISAKFYSGCDP